MKRALRLPLFFGVISSFMPACADYYVKPGSTTADFNRDKRECKRVAEKECLKNGTRPCDEIERCLEAKGWKQD